MLCWQQRGSLQSCFFLIRNGSMAKVALFRTVSSGPSLKVEPVIDEPTLMPSIVSHQLRDSNPTHFFPINLKILPRLANRITVGTTQGQMRLRFDIFVAKKIWSVRKKNFCLFILFCSINEVWRKVTLYAILYLIEANFWAKRFGKQFGVTSSTSLCSLLNISGRKRVCTSTEVRSWII